MDRKAQDLEWRGWRDQLSQGVAMMRLKCPFRLDIMEFTLKTSIFTRQEMSENSILFSVNIAIF